jgi:hypothetical protein
VIRRSSLVRLPIPQAGEAQDETALGNLRYLQARVKDPLRPPALGDETDDRAGEARILLFTLTASMVGGKQHSRATALGPDTGYSLQTHSAPRTSQSLTQGRGRICPPRFYHQHHHQNPRRHVGRPGARRRQMGRRNP